MAVSITNLKKQLMERIDTTDLMQVEKVERYIVFIQRIRKMQTVVNKEGESIVVKNGSQEFIKAHPLLSEINKANAQIINIEKSFGFPSEVVEEIKRSANDLI